MTLERSTNRGNLHFQGRAKDVIVTAAGLNIFPEDLEEALNQQPEVHASCVINSKGAHGDEPLAVLILRKSNANVASIIDRANGSLAEYQQIRHWHIWNAPDFPLTATQKILRRQVAATIEAGVKRNGYVSVPNSAVVAEAMRISGAELSSSTDISLKLATDLKLDSMGRIELLSALEDKYQIEIDEAAFTEATTVGDVEDIISGEVSEGSMLQQATSPTVPAKFPYSAWSHRFPVTWIRVLLFYTIYFSGDFCHEPTASSWCSKLTGSVWTSAINCESRNDGRPRFNSRWTALTSATPPCDCNGGGNAYAPGCTLQLIPAFSCD